ncbi:MAG: phage holin family protein [Candidatus Methylomirabilis sp.]|nr:phage holin family protein [Deltaproteobacteria bacterium]
MYRAHLITRFLLSALSLLVADAIVDGVRIEGLGHVFLAALALGLVNAFIRPLILLLTLPLTIVTLGLFVFVVNALTFQIAAWIIPGFHVDGFWPAFGAALIVSLVSTALNWFLGGGQIDVRIVRKD